MNLTPKIKTIMQERFGHDTLLSVATAIDNIPFVRIVNSYYEDGAFYTVTYALSNKMKQIEKNPAVAVCGEWFTAHGAGENLGWIRDEKNTEIAAKLRAAFASWYDNGHTNEADPNTCILRICLTNGVLADNGIWSEIDF
jgi:general stress protein 26